MNTTELELINRILKSILENGDIDLAIKRLSQIIEEVTSTEAQPQPVACQVAFAQELLSN